jgi:hypothetical protein
MFIKIHENQYSGIFPFLGEINIVETKDALKQKIEKMEKEIPYLTGKKKVEAKREYLQLLKSSDQGNKLNQPIYLRRK